MWRAVVEPRLVIVALPVLLSALGVVVIYAPNLSVLGVESRTVGLILMLGGLAGLSIGLFVSTRRSRAHQTDRLTGHR